MFQDKILWKRSGKELRSKRKEGQLKNRTRKRLAVKYCKSGRDL